MRKEEGVHTRDLCLLVLLLLILLLFGTDIFQQLHDLTIDTIRLRRQPRRALDLKRIDLHHAVFDVLKRLDVAVQFIQFAACAVHRLRRFTRGRGPPLHLGRRRISDREQIRKVTQLCLVRCLAIFLVIRLIPRCIVGNTDSPPIFADWQNVNALFHPL